MNGYAAGNRTLLRHGETGADDLTYYEYNAANELTSLHAAAGWTYFGYDQNGNTVMEQAPSYTRYFDWDGRDMLTGVRSTEQGWTDNEIRYDGLASRAELLDSTGTTRYAWDGIRVLKLEDEEGDLKQRQVHGHAPIPSVGDIALMESAAGDPYAPVADQVGTVVKVLGSAGAVANAYQYDAFGVSRAVSESFANPFRFAGKPLDPDSSLYHFGTKRLGLDSVLYHFIARQYAPSSGLFISRDSRERYERPASYDYVSSCPTVATDPNGESWRVMACRIACLFAIGNWSDCYAACDVLELCEDFDETWPRKERCKHPRHDRQGGIEDCKGCPGKGLDFVGLCTTCCLDAFPPAHGDQTSDGKACSAMCEEEGKKKRPPGAR